MGRTITPELGAEVAERLYGYALEYRPLFGRSDQFKQGRVYLHGLLLDGERKSIEPLSRRVPGGNEQNLQQFVNQSPWDPGPDPARLSGPDGGGVRDRRRGDRDRRHRVPEAGQALGG